MTQHFPSPLLREIRKFGRWAWPVADFVDVLDSFIELTLREPFRRIFLARPNFLLHPGTLANPVNENIFTPSAKKSRR